MSAVIASFEQLALSAPILSALETLGYETPSPIQAESIPPLMAGHDLLGQAQTGTGKTAAFALPLLNRLDLNRAEPQVLVLAPTRELAIQVAEAFQSYARNLKGFHVLPIYGGQSMSIQLRQLQRGAHIIVGTPGRVMDHLRRGSLKLESLQTVVLDEADEMLRMGFIEDVEWILEHTPQERQVVLFSATMPDAIHRVAKRHLHDPTEVRIKAKTATVANIEQSFWKVSGLHKLDALTRMLEVEPFDAAIIFVRTKTATVELAEKLEARGYASAPLNGDMNQAMRERTIEQLKNQKLDIVVATDVVARGLDVKRISHVINYDIPSDVEAYIHRIGRTGRAGRKGKAILFVAPREMRMLRIIEKVTRQPLEPLQLPSGEMITDQRIAQFKQQILDVIENEELDFFQEVIEQLQQEQSIPLEQITAALAYQVQRERPLQVKFKELKPEPRERRPERGERPERRREHDDSDMVTYRIEVGRDHGVEVRDIVGAIANEAGIESRYIGRIKLFDNFSLVDLPDGMSGDVFQHLKKVRVRQQMLDIKPDRGARKPAGKKGFKGGGPKKHHRKG